MELTAYLQALRKSWWIVVICLLAGGAAAFIDAERQTPVYAAHNTFYVISSNSSTSDQVVQNQADTFAGLLSSDMMANLVSSATKMELAPADIRDKISGSAALNTALITATVHDSSRQQALVIATAISTEYPKMVTQLGTVGTKQSAVEAKLVSGPNVDVAPVSPRKKLDLLVGLLVGLAVGVIGAVTRQLFASLHTVKSVD